MKVPCKIQITGRPQYLRILEAHLVTKTVDPFQNNIPNNRKSFSLEMISGWSERHHMIRILQSILKGLIFTGIKFRGDLISRVKWPRNPRIFYPRENFEHELLRNLIPSKFFEIIFPRNKFPRRLDFFEKYCLVTLIFGFLAIFRGLLWTSHSYFQKDERILARMFILSLPKNLHDQIRKKQQLCGGK